jgi:hypothetical protein
MQKEEPKMKATRIILILAIATLIFCASATTAYAQLYITGNLYRVQLDPNLGCADPITHQPPDPTLVPPRNPDVTFLVPTFLNGIPLDFNDVYWQNGLIADVWLTHGSNPAINVMGLRRIKYHDLSDFPCTYVSVIDFTGMVTVFDGEVFTFDVDDNIWLEINGVVVTQRVMPKHIYSRTYTGRSGTFPFRLVYLETNDVRARLTVTNN